MNPEAVLIDAGGVLLDEKKYYSAVQRLIVKLIRSIDKNYDDSRYIHDLNESINRFSPHNLRYVIWKNCSGNAELFKNLLAEFRNERGQTRQPLALMDGITDELRSLAEDFSLVLAGQYGKSLMELLDQYDLSGLFVNRKTQDDFGITKPDPRYYGQILESAGFAGNQCIMIGDRIDKDVIPAKQCGMGTVFVRTGIFRNQQPRTPDEQPDITLESVHGMARAVKEHKWN